MDDEELDFDDRTDEEALSDLLRQGETRRRPGRMPARIGDVVNQLIARRGYMQTLAADELRDAWRQAVGTEFAQESVPGVIRRNVLEVIVADSALMQELTFRKTELLGSLQRQLPHLRLKDVRFRVGAVSD